jgi:Uma2 family endonuclease
MSALPTTTISRAEYLRRERLAQYRSEYHRGQMVAMSVTSRIHSRIATNLVRLLDSQLLEGPCNTYTGELRVSVGAGEHYVNPDLIVTSGDEVFEDDEFDTLVNPLVIVEIQFPSTEAYDRGEKFRLYQAIVSLREYVLVSQTQRRIEVFRKQPDGLWLYQSCPPSPSPLHLEAIDCTLDLDDVYRKVEIEEASPDLPGPSPP